MRDDEIFDTPYIHVFTCSTGCYVYDVNTDTILKITEDSYDRLHRNVSLSNYNGELLQLMQNGYLKKNRVRISEHPASALLKNYYESKIHSLVLQVTQQCNLRCRYCVYSGHYKGRTHSGRRMSWNIAKQAIDLVVGHSRDCSEFEFGFYGGEPLLAFDLIKQCVEYIHRRFPGKSVTYYLTTNATLLTCEMMDFFCKNEFMLTISLDGPEYIHDKYRVYADVSRRGTFNDVVA